MSHTAVVILNWNGEQMLQRFMPSVMQHTEAEVIVADNASTDGSVAFLQTHYPEVRLIRLDRNYGFAEGYNRALAQVEADYYVLLNSDVECTPGWVSAPIAMMEADPSVAVVQPKLRMYDDKRLFEYAGGAGGYIDSFGYPFCRGRLFTTIEEDHGQYDDPCEVFWATGAAMFVRASTWREVGGLDNSFFAHMEEIDFCWRVKLAGYRVMYCPGATLFHVGGGTLPKSSPFKTQLNFRNNLCMLYKNLPRARRRWLIPMRMVLDGVASLKFLAEGHRGEFEAVIKAHKEFRQRRKQLQQSVNPQRVSCVYRGLLLVEYYLMRRTRFPQLHGRWS